MIVFRSGFVVLTIFFGLCLPVMAQDPALIGIFLSENEVEYTRTATAFRTNMGNEVKFHTFDLSGMDHRDLEARRLLAQARQLKPQFFLAVGQKAFFLLKDEKEIPIVFAGIPDYLSTAIENAQKKGKLQKISGVYWGDRDCALNGLKAFRELLPEGKSLGIIYSEFSWDLIQTLEAEAAKMGIKIHARKIRVEGQVVPTIREMVDKVDAFLVPKRDRIASQVVVRNRLFEIATTENKIPVISTHEVDLKRGALAVVDLDVTISGKQAAALALQIQKNNFQKGPVIEKAQGLVFQKKFNVRVARDLQVTPPTSKKWEMVE